MRRWWIFRMVFMGIVIFLAVSLAVMLLWNWLVPVLFNGPSINLWQAIGLLALSKILFGGFGPGRWGGGHYARRRAWRKKFEQKWSNMTPEEKEKFKENFMHGCGSWRQAEKEPAVQKV